MSLRHDLTVEGESNFVLNGYSLIVKLFFNHENIILRLKIITATVSRRCVVFIFRLYFILVRQCLKVGIWTKYNAKEIFSLNSQKKYKITY